MKAEDADKNRALLARALTSPFAGIPMRLDFVIWERVIPLRNISQLRPGDFLSFDQLSLRRLDVRLGDVSLGCGAVLESDSKVPIQLIEWREAD